jgi:hypothetical protein
MRSCTNNPLIRIPYFDASLDSQNMEDSPVWDYIGGNGGRSGTGGGCVRQGPFANFQMQHDNKHCLRRNFRTRIAIQSPESIDLMMEEDDFNTFRDLFEV